MSVLVLMSLVAVAVVPLTLSPPSQEQRLSCADSAVQAIWTLPQAPVVRSWRALFKLLDDEEAGGGRGTRGGGRSGGGRGGGGGGEGALNGGEQTVAARVLLTAARMAAGEAASGRRKAGGQSLSKEAKQVCGILFDEDVFFFFGRWCFLTIFAQ